MIGRTVMVTGGTGFIGSHLVDSLVAAGMRVRCLVRPASRRSARARHAPPVEVEPVIGDLLSGQGLERTLEEADVIFHVAGVTKASRVADYYTGNVRATQNLIAACEKAGTRRLVHVSSLAAAGPSPDGRPLREDSPPHPVSHYGRSKLCAEEAVRRSGLAERAVIVRPAVVYGPRDTDVLEVLLWAAGGRVIQLGGRDQQVSILHVADLIEGLLLAAAAEHAGGRIYFLANSEPVSWSELGYRAASLMGRPAKTVSVPLWGASLAGALASFSARLTGTASLLSWDKMKEARQRFWICDPAAARIDLGFRACTPLSEGLAATLAWYRERGWLKY